LGLLNKRGHAAPRFDHMPKGRQVSLRIIKYESPTRRLGMRGPLYSSPLKQSTCYDQAFVDFARMP
jgi:hypothetical protein